MAPRIHPTVEIADGAVVGDGTIIWHGAQIREGVSVGQHCVIGRGVYIDADVAIGNYCKIQNYVSLFRGVIIEDGVFIGPHVCFTNDLRPRAINPDGSMKGMSEWTVTQTVIKYGASLGASTTVICGVTIDNWAMVGAGSVVTRNVPAFGLVFGNPAQLHGFVCPCGARLREMECVVGAVSPQDSVQLSCQECRSVVVLPKSMYYSQASNDSHF